MSNVNPDDIKAGYTLGYADAQILRDAVKEQIALRKFFETGIRQAFDGCHFDGGEMQELAVQLGLLREEAYDPEKHRELVPDPSLFVGGDPVYFIV